MNRLLLCLTALVCVATTALAQPATNAISRVEFCRIRNADGSYSITQGAPIPLKIVPIRTLSENAKPRQSSEASRATKSFSPEDNTTVYQNTGGEFFVAEEGPSCLDDLVLTSAANNKAWKIVTFGVHLVDNTQTGKFLVRWRGYETYVGGLGQLNSAFHDELFDFGFYLNRNQFPSGPGSYMITADLSLNPLAIVPNQTCFLAQQFREPQLPVEQGEGAWTNVWNVFANQGPQVGTSQDLFWYDYDLNGIYDETEADQFDPEQGGAGAGSFLFKIEVGGNTTVSTPFTFQWIRGTLLSGTVGTLWYDDQLYMRAVRFRGPATADPAGQLVVESFSPTTSPAGIRVDVDAKVTQPGLSMSIQMWNYDTNQWVLVATGPVNTTDTKLIGFGASPAAFVDEFGSIRAKINFFDPNRSNAASSWQIFVDQVVWTITTP
jgi:hypothetical protein